MEHRRDHCTLARVTWRAVAVIGCDLDWRQRCDLTFDGGREARDEAVFPHGLPRLRGKVDVIRAGHCYQIPGVRGYR
jgi:hypothetical protein